MARDLVVRIVGDSSSLERSLKRSENATKRFGQQAGRTQQQVSVGLPGLGKTALAYGAIGTASFAASRAIRASFEEFSEMQKVTAQTQAVLKSTGAVANVTAGHVQDLANEILRYSGIDDEAVAAGENLLLTFKNVRNEAGRGNQIFDRATRAAADLSIAWGTDMSSAAIKLGKAVNDPVRGITALQRVGITFTTVQRNQIKALVEAGQVLEAQKIILAEVESQVGGSARAFGETLPGQVNKAREQLRNLGGELVTKLAPAMSDALELLIQMADAAGKLRDAFDKVGGSRIKDFLDRTFGKAPTWFKAFGPQGPLGLLFKPPTQPVLNLANAWETVGDAIGNAARNLDPFRRAFADITAAFAGAARKFGPPPKTTAQAAFGLPGPLRLAQARAEVTGTAADDVLVAQRIKAFIEARIAAGKLKGQRLIDALGALGAAQGVIESAMETEASKRREAAEKEATARRKHADALKKTAERLVQETDRFRQQIGDLFAPLPDTVLRAQRRAELGLPGPDPRQLVTGLREQTAAFEANQRNLRRLRRAGAPGRLIDELQGRGLEVAPQVAALAGASRLIQRQFFAAFRRREEAARKAAERPININVRVFLDDRDITTRVITRAQRTARHQGKQRRGRHGGAAMGLA